MRKEDNWKNKYKIEGGKQGGGNADVYFVQDKSTGKKYALKELRYNNKQKKTYSKEKQKRFQQEIFVLKNNASEVPGVLPIIEYSTKNYWYTMPIAMPIMKYIEDKEIIEIIMGVVQLATTLEILHSKGIKHRDIKPANIYFYQDRFTLGDFGLVDFPEKFDECTRSDKGLGAIFTIAPEMKRNPQKADGKKADVFSLAKTMWMFLTRDERGFDGVYDYLDPKCSLRFYDKYKDTHLVEIDEVLRKATNNDPEIRPTMKEFKEELEFWCEVYNDKRKSQLLDWKFLEKQLFGQYPPESCFWKNKKHIVEVLNTVAKIPAYNHMFLHDRGGFDFERAEMAAEIDCIKLYDAIGDCYVVKPKGLFYEGFGENFEWNYFLLELCDLDPILEKRINSDLEYLVEDTPAHYVSAQYEQYGVYDYETGEKLPEGYNVVHRYLKGKLLIVLKLGPYNAINATYDGRHGDCNAMEFKQYIGSLIKQYQKIYNQISQHKDVFKFSEEEIEYKILNLKEFSKNPFKTEDIDCIVDTNLKEERENTKKCEEFFEQNYDKWNFESIMSTSEKSADDKIKFIFTFSKPNEILSLDSLRGMDNCLCKDGYIKKENITSEECYGIYTRDKATHFLKEIEIKIAQFLDDNHLKCNVEDERWITIRFVKCGKPIHLFTKEEIYNLMKNSDDRNNNQLIIDENGYARILENSMDGYLYPVRHEMWNAGNNYVGKYSTYSTLEDVYIMSLQGWLLYLKTGKSQMMDYVHDNVDSEKLEKEIKHYY